MTEERRLEILALLATTNVSDLIGARLCEVAAEVTSATGAGVVTFSEDISSSTVCSTDAVSAHIEELQFELGEGPCVDAFHLGRPVLEPDLADPETLRWTAFSPLAVAAGVQGLFAFPLHVGKVRVGALDLYSDRAGPLTNDQYADALTVADVIARSVIAMQAAAPAGSLAPELSVAGDFRLIVHQAAGMVSVQLDVGLDEALVRLRARAFSEDRPLIDLADDVVRRRLRLDAGNDPASEAP